MFLFSLDSHFFHCLHNKHFWVSLDAQHTSYMLSRYMYIYNNILELRLLVILVTIIYINIKHVAVFFRFSNGGTKSVLHTDSYENLHCLASGIKEFVLIPPEFSDVIGPEHAELGYYCIDVEKYVLIVMVTLCNNHCC